MASIPTWQKTFLRFALGALQDVNDLLIISSYGAISDNAACLIPRRLCHAAKLRRTTWDHHRRIQSGGIFQIEVRCSRPVLSLRSSDPTPVEELEISLRDAT